MIDIFPDGPDMQVRPELQPPDGRFLGADFGIIDPGNKAIVQCVDALILSLLMALSLGYAGVRYSRNRNHYHTQTVPLPSYWRLESVTKAAQLLEQATIHFVHRRQAPQIPNRDSRQRRQSAFRPTKSLTSADFTGHLFGISVRPRDQDRVLLRDNEKRAQASPDKLIVRQTIEFLARYDAALASASFGLHHPDLRETEQQGVYSVPNIDGTQRRVQLGAIHPVRIFNVGLTSGGRFYHMFWLNLSAVHRTGITIDGEATYEYDFSGCHLRLAHMGLGLDDPLQSPTRDLYAFMGSSPHLRKLTKQAVQILLNAKTHKQAEIALFHGLPGRNNERRRAVAQRVIKQIGEQFGQINSLWGRGIGTALQYVDSEIIRICLTKLLDKGIVGLPVHDSIIVASRHRNALVQIMDETFANEGAKLALQRLRYFRGSGQRGNALAKKGEARKNIKRREPIETRTDKKLSKADHKRKARWKNGIIPTIISPDATECWRDEGISRTKFYETVTDPVERQVVSIECAMRRRLEDIVERARVDLVAVHTFRQEYCGDAYLPIDRLLDELDKHLLPRSF